MQLTTLAKSNGQFMCTVHQQQKQCVIQSTLNEKYFKDIQRLKTNCVHKFEKKEGAMGATIFDTDMACLGASGYFCEPLQKGYSCYGITNNVDKIANKADDSLSGELKKLGITKADAVYLGAVAGAGILLGGVVGVTGRLAQQQTVGRTLFTISSNTDNVPVATRVTDDIPTAIIVGSNTGDSDIPTAVADGNNTGNIFNGVINDEGDGVF